MTYAKALAAVLAAVLSAVAAAFTGDNYISPVEWINVAILGVSAASVFSAPNVPGARYTKAVLAVLAAVLTLAVNLIADGITVSEWLQLGVAAVGALSVYVVPNSGSGAHHLT